MGQSCCGKGNTNVEGDNTEFEGANLSKKKDNLIMGAHGNVVKNAKPSEG